MEHEERKLEQGEAKAEGLAQPSESIPGGAQVTETKPSGDKKSKKRMVLIVGALVVVVLVAAFLFYRLYLQHPSRQVLAVVNGEKITVEQFNREIEKIQLPERDMYKEEPQQFLDGMILRLLILQEAKKEGISVPPKTYKDTLPPEEALIAEFMKKKFGAAPAVTRQEVENFYNAFKTQMAGKKLAEVAPLIEQMIQEAKQREALETFVEDLRQKAKIDYQEGTLKRIATKPPESNTEEEFKKALQSGKPTLVDFGANSCAPCRLLRPVLKEIDKEYSNKAHILVIDVYKFQRLAREYKIMVIPTLVFFDVKGQEVFRHMGVLEKEKIISKLKEIGMAS
jgi:thioredoxin 1